jgi:SWIM zinc finger
MADWTLQQIQQLAPDTASMQAGQGLAKPNKWQSLGCNERLLWGECQGSGANPYQVRVDVQDTAYKCNCPSRKLPCKHTLALLVLMVEGAVPVAANLPEFVSEWSGNRAKRTEAKQSKATAAVPDTQAQAKRTEKREARVQAGIEQLEAWLGDIVAQGLAAARTQPLSFWTQMAARQVDAQAPGLARRVRALGDVATGSQWQHKLLAELARLQLLLDAYRNLERLPSPLAAEVRQLIGWSQDQESVRSGAALRDHWMVLARRQFEDEQLRVQRTWLYGQRSERPALILEFAVGTQPLPATFVTGQCLDAELVYFEGIPQLRALEKVRHPTLDARITVPKLLNVAALQTGHAARLSVNPWLERWPVMLGPVIPLFNAERWYLEDAAGRRVPLVAGVRHGWNLLALSNGGICAIFGEWDGESFDPMTVQCRERWFTLVQQGELPLLAQVA